MRLVKYPLVLQVLLSLSCMREVHARPKSLETPTTAFVISSGCINVLRQPGVDIRTQKLVYSKDHTCPPFATFCSDTDVGHGPGVLLLSGTSISIQSCFNELETVAKTVPLECDMTAKWDASVGRVYLDLTRHIDGQGYVIPKCLQYASGNKILVNGKEQCTAPAKEYKMVSNPYYVNCYRKRSKFCDALEMKLAPLPCPVNPSKESLQANPPSFNCIKPKK